MVLLYVDTMIVIEAVEQDGSIGGEIVFELDADVISSEVTLAEVLVAPVRSGNESICFFYEMLFDAGTRTIDSRPVTLPILKRAAALRARHSKLRLFDAIYLGTAIDARCTHFGTKDRELLKVIAIEHSNGRGIMPIAADEHDARSIRQALRS